MYFKTTASRQMSGSKSKAIFEVKVVTEKNTGGEERVNVLKDVFMKFASICHPIHKVLSHTQLRISKTFAAHAKLFEIHIYVWTIEAPFCISLMVKSLDYIL
jgi:hypothetical protein